MNNLKKCKKCSNLRAKDFIDGDECDRKLFCAFGKPWHTNDKKQK
jgi:hypothetical protein